MKVLNLDESQEHRAVIRVVQSENILLRFLPRGHADDGCSCNYRAVPLSDYNKFDCEIVKDMLLKCPNTTMRTILTLRNRWGSITDVSKYHNAGKWSMD